MGNLDRRLSDLENRITEREQTPKITYIEIWGCNDNGSDELLEVWSWTGERYEITYERPNQED